MPLSVGQKAQRSLHLTEEHVRLYAQITGDHNPLHFDPDFAAGTRFGRLVVQGGLTTGLLHALVAMDLPGPGTVFLSQNWKFVAPVYHRRHDHRGSRSAQRAPDQARHPARREGVEGGGETVLEGEAWCYRFGAE